jgi:hypothetical protein
MLRNERIFSGDIMSRRLSIALVISGLFLGCTQETPQSLDVLNDASPDTFSDGSAEDADDSQNQPTDVSEPVDTWVQDTALPDLGPPPEPHVCTGTTDGQLQPFGGACCYTEVGHPDNPDCLWSSDNYNQGACLDAQCADGYCSSSKYCSKGCSFLIDQSNNQTGAEGYDGVQDTSLPDDCALAADGPYGSEYHCINQSQPGKKANARCRPGTTFAPCESSADCPENEACQLLYILGETEARCMTIHQDAVGLAESCNSDPNAGNLVPCEGPFCYGWGCTELCDLDETCATDTCADGTCSKSGTACDSSSDCTALTCNPYSPWSDSPFSDGFCQPKKCLTDAECSDPDWFCRPYWNGATKVEDVAYDPSCRKRAEGAAKAGEACSADGSGAPMCSYQYGCIDGICASPCQENDDCPAETECFLGNSWNIDVDDDEEVDTYVNIDLCQPWPHNGDVIDCTEDSDCDEGEHCQYRLAKNDVIEGVDMTQWHVEYKCRDDLENQAAFGETCGSVNGKSCGSDLCLVPSNSPDGTPNLCTKYCNTSADCPETIFYDGFTWKTTCLGFNVNQNQTLDPIDDIYVGYCWVTSNVASGSNCDDTKTCEGAMEYCRANAIGGNPDEPVIVEHLCLDYSQGLEAIPTGAVGEPCETWQDCMGRRCMTDGKEGGYCSELCSVDADCQSPGGLPNLRCTEEVLLERPNPEHSGKTSRCIIAEACLSCEADNDCGGDYLCMNVGGLANLAEMRCAAPCGPDNACDDEELSCVEGIDATGTPTGEFGCKPLDCE